MKKVLTKIKDNLITGAIIIVPLVIVGVILSDVIKKIIALTTPFTDNMDLGGPVARAIIATLILLVVIGLFFFLTGLLTKTYLGKSFRNWLENNVYSHIPFYQTFISVAKQITHKEKDNYPVVEVDLYGNNNKLLGLQTDKLDDDRLVVYVPFAPVINIGQVHIVAKENVKTIDISVKEATDLMTRIGFETNKAYKKPTDS